MKKLAALPAIVGMLAFGLWTQAEAQTATYTTSLSSMSRDSYGNPKQISLVISGSIPTSYEVCLDKASPVLNATGDYSRTYMAGGSTYGPCKKFTWTKGASNSRSFGTNFSFAGGGQYTAHWYVPDKTTNPTEVGSAKTFNWANSSGTASPCPPDGQLQIGVWRPSRHQILNRCKTYTGKDRTSAGSRANSLDSDRNWTITYGTSTRHVEFVARDWNTSVNGGTAFLPSPSYGASYTITGIYVCDLYHGWREWHPVFKVVSSTGTYYSGPQYSTYTPTVSGTWSLHSCG